MSANELRRIARRREPMFNAPIVVLGLVAVLVGIYAAFNWSPVAIQDRVIRDYAFIPGRLTIAIWPDRLVDLLNRVNTDPAALQQARDALDSVAMDEDGGELPLSIEDGAMPPVDLSGYDNPLVVVIPFEVTAHAAA